MASRAGQKIKLTSIDELLCVPETEGTVDIDVRAIYPFKDIKDLVSKKPMGGGGTDANCIFKYFEEERDYKIGKKKKPSVILIFTDGYFSVVHDKYKKYKDVIWIIKDNKNFKPPFGVVAPFKQDEN